MMDMTFWPLESNNDITKTSENHFSLVRNVAEKCQSNARHAIVAGTLSNALSRMNLAKQRPNEINCCSSATWKLCCICTTLRYQLNQPLPGSF